jgi:hypothetical protein
VHRDVRERQAWETLNSVFKALTKVNSLGPNPQLLIALHSPNALLKTGLHMCPPEKNRYSDGLRCKQSVLRSPVCLGIIAKYGHCSRFSAHSEPNFSGLQTAWRRELDSNPRYRSECLPSSPWGCRTRFVASFTVTSSLRFRTQLGHKTQFLESGTCENREN